MNMKFFGRMKHANFSFEFSHKFLRYGRLQFHDFGGRGYHKAYCKVQYDCLTQTELAISLLKIQELFTLCSNE